jgi:cytochrome P450
MFDMSYSIFDFLPAWIPSWLVVALPVVYAYYKYVTWEFGVFKKLGINGPKPVPVFGTLGLMMKEGLPKHDLDLKAKYGSVVGTFQGRSPCMLIYDLDILKQILIKDFGNFTNHAPLFFEHPLDKMLSTLTDDHWRHVRNILTPTFSSGKLRKMTGQINRCTDTLCKNLQTRADSQEVFDFRGLTGAYTMDVIASTAFRVEIDSQNDPENQFVRMGKKPFEFNLASPKMLISFFFPFLVKPLAKIGFGAFPKDVTQFFVSAVNKALEERGDESKSQTDFLQIMLNAHLEENEDDKARAAPEKKDTPRESATTWNKKGLTHDEIIAQGLMFFLAGYETTANVLALFGYNLATYPECQEKLHQEIVEVAKGQEKLTHDLVQEMPYLDRCLSETLRMYPSGPRTDRIASEDTTINGLFIPKGMTVGVPIYAIQNDPSVWPEPEKFNPDRFLPAAKEGRDPGIYMPFGIGPRNCVGMRLALMEMKMAMARILQKFKLVQCAETEIPLKMDKMSMKGANGIKIKVQQR